MYCNSELLLMCSVLYNCALCNNPTLAGNTALKCCSAEAKGLKHFWSHCSATSLDIYNKWCFPKYSGLQKQDVSFHSQKHRSVSFEFSPRVQTTSFSGIGKKSKLALGIECLKTLPFFNYMSFPESFLEIFSQQHRTKLIFFHNTIKK